MNSSIFNSKQSLPAALLAFVGGLLVAAALASVIYYNSPDIRATHQAIKNFSRPTKSAVVSTLFSTIDQAIYTYDFFGVIDNASKAQVIFAGDSRIAYAIDYKIANNFFAKKNISFHSLAMGHGEAMPFLYEMQTRYDLRPKVLVVNAPNFFSPTVSLLYAKAKKQGVWAARKEVYNYQIFYAVAKKLHTFFPKLYNFKGFNNLLWRDMQTGLWLPGVEETIAIPILPMAERTPRNINEQALKLAANFKELLAQRNIRLVFTILPTSKDNLDINTVAAMANKLKIPLIYVEDKAMATYDDSHLNGQSRKLWTTLFLGELEKRLY